MLQHSSTWRACCTWHIRLDGRLACKCQIRWRAAGPGPMIQGYQSSNSRVRSHANAPAPHPYTETYPQHLPVLLQPRWAASQGMRVALLRPRRQGCHLRLWYVARGLHDCAYAWRCMKPDAGGNVVHAGRRRRASYGRSCRSMSASGCNNNISSISTWARGRCQAILPR